MTFKMFALLKETGLKEIGRKIIVYYFLTITAEGDRVYDPVVRKADGMNVLGMVVFSIVTGVILGRMGERGRPLCALFECTCELTMRLVQLVIW